MLKIMKKNIEKKTGVELEEHNNTLWFKLSDHEYVLIEFVGHSVNTGESFFRTKIENTQEQRYTTDLLSTRLIDVINTIREHTS